MKKLKKKIHKKSKTPLKNYFSKTNLPSHLLKVTQNITWNLKNKLIINLKKVLMLILLFNNNNKMLKIYTTNLI